jgi:2-polyprenyl-6-methoxyphenol hydroxylase-like FAD-dependent oxidoreductase
MSPPQLDVDVAVVGASLAGCTAARLLGSAGVRVALVERHADPEAYKRLCGHYIQASATPVLQRLGVTEAIEAAGGVRNGVDVWTPWGWIAPRPRDGEPRTFGYSLRRAKLDPILRGLAAGTDGVTLIAGSAVVGLLGDGGRCTGVVARDRDGRDTAVRARLVVGADGRASKVARLAGAPEHMKPNNRICYMAYYEGGERRPDARGALWLLGRDVVIAAPNDDGLTLVATFAHKAHLAAFKSDREAAFTALVQRTGEASPLRGARRVSPFVGYRDYPPCARAAVPAQGIALVGDAALTCDPTMAIGCGWALQSASWLADAALPALRGEEPLERGLRRYRRRRRCLTGHARMLDAAARAEPPNALERLMIRAAASDAGLARHFERYTSRSIPVRRFLAPHAVARAGWVGAVRLVR